MSTDHTALPSEELAQLRQAQTAFETYFDRCFWFMRPDLTVTKDLLPKIIQGLRSHGDHKAFLIAEELCR